MRSSKGGDACVAVTGGSFPGGETRPYRKLFRSAEVRCRYQNNGIIVSIQRFEEYSKKGLYSPLLMVSSWISSLGYHWLTNLGDNLIA
jgi:hypothetical protein